LENSKGKGNVGPIVEKGKIQQPPFKGEKGMGSKT